MANDFNDVGVIFECRIVNDCSVYEDMSCLIGNFAPAGVSEPYDIIVTLGRHDGAMTRLMLYNIQQELTRGQRSSAIRREERLVASSRMISMKDFCELHCFKFSEQTKVNKGGKCNIDTFIYSSYHKPILFEGACPLK